LQENELYKSWCNGEVVRDNMSIASIFFIC
jgi:hypothetical protein